MYSWLSYDIFPTLLFALVSGNNYRGVSVIFSDNIVEREKAYANRKRVIGIHEKYLTMKLLSICILGTIVKYKITPVFIRVLIFVIKNR